MSDYTRIYNLTVKDSLPTGNSGKVIKGTELDAELNAVAAAISSKADTNSPTFTGVPAAPTATAGTNTTQVATTAYVINERTTAGTLTNKTINLSNNTLVATSAQIAAAVTDETGSGSLVFGTSPTIATPSISSPTITGTPVAPTAAYGTSTTQLATTAFVQAALQAVYPVGSIYINASSTTNPATLLGFGTWTAFGAGKVIVGQDTSDTLFDALEETGGSKDAIVVSHSHTASSTSSSTSTVTDPGHTHALPNSVLMNTGSDDAVDGNGSDHSSPSDGHVADRITNSNTTGITVATSTTTSTTVASTGSSATNANVQPFIVVKMWKRTA